MTPPFSRGGCARRYVGSLAAPLTRPLPLPHPAPPPPPPPLLSGGLSSFGLGGSLAAGGVAGVAGLRAKIWGLGPSRA